MRRMLRRLTAATIAAAVVTIAAPASVMANDETTVTIGIANSVSDAPFFLAKKLGYFTEAGIVPKFQTFDSAAKMIAPLGTGQLDVGAGGPSAGLYNAIARGVDIKIVADKGSTPKGFGFMPLLVRKSLVDSGKYHGPKDLKGLRVAESAQGSSSAPDLEMLLRKVGLGYNDVQHVFMGFPEQALAFQNGSIDASFTTEPAATLAIRSGAAVRAIGDDEIHPNQQLAVLFYSGSFIHRNPQLAERFMQAYLKGVRYYNDALKGDRLKGRTSNDVIKTLIESTPLKDPAIYREMVPNANDPNGHVNVTSLLEDYKFFKSLGLVQGDVDVEKVVDPSFAAAAVKKLGRYKANN
jgi:NitT/TauT family transport system substrate-binding protein